jgi:hypothetical protein
MKPVIVYTLNKQETLVPHYQDFMESYRYDAPPNFICDSGNEPYKEARIDRVVMPIIEIVNAKQFDRLGLERMYSTSYVAVDPELMKVLRYKHEQELSIQYENLNSMIDDLAKVCEEYSDRLIAFYKLPWYKRIWKAITLYV